MPKASSKAITSSTWSSESAPRSSTNEAVGVTSASSTPSCSTIICFTRSSTLAILIVPPISAIWNPRPLHTRGWDPKTTCPFYASAYAGSTLGDNWCKNSAHVHAAVHIEYLPCDIAGFVAREKHNRGGHISVRAKTPERNQRLHLVFDFLRERVGHGRGD